MNHELYETLTPTYANGHGRMKVKVCLLKSNFRIGEPDKIEFETTVQDVEELLEIMRKLK